MTKMKPEQLRRVIGFNVKAKRQLLHMTQTELGERCGGVSSARISQIESGREPISSDMQALLAEALGTETNVLNTPGAFHESKKSLAHSA